MRLGVALFALALPLVALAGCVAVAQTSTASGRTPVGGGGAIPARGTRLPVSASQGAMVIGNTHPDAMVEYAGHRLQVTPDGDFVFGIGRDASGVLVVRIRQRDSEWVEHRIAVAARDWPIERIVGVPPATINPPPQVAARIAREQALVSAVRVRDDARTDFEQDFSWPVHGRISGRFGNQRLYVLPDGSEAPKSPHSGMDIAVAAGTPVAAPASGIVTFAAPDLYLTGGTVVLDHGYGISSNFLHLSRIDVNVGGRVEQGQIIGAVGMTGRATGPHLHWGMNWFDVRIDPLLLLERGQ